MIGQANAGAIAGFFKQVLKDSPDSSRQRQVQDDRETIAVAKLSNAIARETLQVVRVNTNKFYEMGDTLGDIRFGIENLAKIFAQQEFEESEGGYNEVGEGGHGHGLIGDALGLMTAVEFASILKSIAIPIAGGLAAHYLDIDESKPGNSDVGAWINENVPGAASLDDYIYRMTGGVVGTSIDDPRYSWNKDKAQKVGAEMAKGQDKGATSVNRAPSASGDVEIRDKKIDVSELLHFKAQTITFKIKESAPAVAMSASEAAAMSSFANGDQYDALGNFLGGNAPGGSAGGSVPASASDAVSYLMGKGWTREQAAGIVGNLQAESNLKVNSIGDGGQAYGIAQWHPDRQANFRKVIGKNIQGSTLQEQLDFLSWELANSEKNAGAWLKNAKTAEEAAVYFDKFFERSKASMGIDIRNRSTWGNAAKRIKYANAIMGALDTPKADTSTPITPTTPSASPSSVSGGAVNLGSGGQIPTGSRNDTGKDISAKSMTSDPYLKPKPSVVMAPSRDRQDVPTTSDNVVQPPPPAKSKDSDVKPLGEFMLDYFDYNAF